jgi:hypothetical protein
MRASTMATEVIRREHSGSEEIRVSYTHAEVGMLLAEIDALRGAYYELAEAAGNKRRERVWCASFASYFAAQVHARMESGEGAPDDDDMNRYAEDAGTIADEAAKRTEAR